MQRRREFLAAIAAGSTATAVFGNRGDAQQITQTFSGPMEQDAYRPVKLAAKPGAAASMTLMSPVKSGFNWLGYVTPSVALGAGAIVVFMMIRKWGERAAQRPVVAPMTSDATPAELEAIDAALKDDR